MCKTKHVCKLCIAERLQRKALHCGSPSRGQGMEGHSKLERTGTGGPQQGPDVSECVIIVQNTTYNIQCYGWTGNTQHRASNDHMLRKRAGPPGSSTGPRRSQANMRRSHSSCPPAAMGTQRHKTRRKRGCHRRETQDQQADQRESRESGALAPKGTPFR